MEPTQVLFERPKLASSAPTDTEFTAITQQQKQITPLLLNELHAFSETPEVIEKASKDYIRHILSIYILAYFKEPKALEPLSKLARQPGDQVLTLTGEVLSEPFGRILASVYHGNLSPITSIIEDPLANPWMRAGALDALMVLWEEQVLSRTEIIAYLKKLINHSLERRSGYVWDSVALLAYDLHPKELQQELTQAIKEQLIEPIVLNLDVLHTRLKEPVSETLTQKASNEAGGFIKHPTDELTWWLYPDTQALDKGMEYANIAVPMVDKKVIPGERQAPVGWRNSSPSQAVKKIGRNEACPCASGKKYKKCCGLT
ncbi:MAG: DUF1186 domain-containing protein [Thiomicrorhabdus sp.]|nr:DUF1186 domain-containing protein [Thiomicrorhabdus sp.]